MFPSYIMKHLQRGELIYPEWVLGMDVLLEEKRQYTRTQQVARELREISIRIIIGEVNGNVSLQQ